MEYTYYEQKVTMQDAELIEGCTHNDRTSQKTFYECYCHSVMGVCSRYSGCEKEAGAMLLYVFGKLFEDMRNYPVKGDVDKWLEDRVIWNAIQYLHRDKHKYFIAKTTVYAENKPSYSRDIEEISLSDEIGKKLYLKALQELTPSYRILYNLTYIDEVPPEDIIGKLQIAEETYKMELDEARYQFKKHLTIRLNEQDLQ